jgi:putative Mg2+ transporter-C (MgtC) family protein
MLVEHLEHAGLPVAELETVELGEDQVTIAATLTSTIVEAGELDRITDHFQTVHGIAHATWAASTHD